MITNGDHDYQAVLRGERGITRNAWAALYGRPSNQVRSQARVASRYLAAFLCNAKLWPECRT